MKFKILFDFPLSLASFTNVYGRGDALVLLDLQDRGVINQVDKQQRGREFVSLLEEVDESHPTEATIRIVLDNHSAHISKKRECIWPPDRTGSCKFILLNTARGSTCSRLSSSKMSRTFLRQIRVASWEEFKKRIMKGVAEINANPIVYRRHNFDFENESA